MPIIVCILPVRCAYRILQGVWHNVTFRFLCQEYLAVNFDMLNTWAVMLQIYCYQITIYQHGSQSNRPQSLMAASAHTCHQHWHPLKCQSSSSGVQLIVAQLTWLSLSAAGAAALMIGTNKVQIL